MTGGLAPSSRPEVPAVRGLPLLAVAVLTVAILGLNWPVMAWGLESIPPLWLTTFRLLGAAAVLAPALAAAGALHRPSRHDLPVVASVALLRLALVYSLVFSGLLLVPPGRASMLVHTAGLWAVPFGIWLLGERPAARTIAGLAAGVAGIVLLAEPWAAQGRPAAPAGYGLLLGAAVATAVAGIHIRRHRWTVRPDRLMPWQLAIAGLATLPAALVVHGLPAPAWTPGELGVIGYQVLLASGIGVWGILTLTRSLPAATSGAVMMAVPVVGVASSVALTGERLSPVAVAGMGLLLGGVWLAVAAGRLRHPLRGPAVSPGAGAR